MTRPVEALVGAVGAPGWCCGPLVHLCAGDLSTLVRHYASQHPRFSAGTRLGLVERTTLAESEATDSASGGEPLPARLPASFVAAIATAEPGQLLVLHRAGAAGFVVSAGAEETVRHAAVVARALGLPLALGMAPDPIWYGKHVDLDTHRSTAEMRLATGARPSDSPAFVPVSRWAYVARVLPISMMPAPGKAAHRQGSLWLELVTGHREECELARQLVDAGRAEGVGLLRLEFVLMASPGIGVTELAEQLASSLEQLSCPTVLRLADWSPRKAPPAGGGLYGWSGERGIEGLTDEAIDAQLEAIVRARDAAASNHELYVVAPFLEGRQTLTSLAEKAARYGLRLGAMLESARGCDELAAFEADVEGFWFGLGDLTVELGERAVDVVSQAIAATELPCFVCGRSV